MEHEEVPAEVWSAPKLDRISITKLTRDDESECPGFHCASGESGDSA